MPRRRQTGYTLIEVSIALVLLAFVIVKISMVLDIARKSQVSDTTGMELEAQAHRILDRISYAVIGTTREKLFPDPVSPVYSSELRYEVSMGIEAGEMVWSAPETIGIGGDDDNQVVWRENAGAEQERRVVWCNVARPFLEGELPNGIDDNGNGLIDEQGLSFALNGNLLTIRLTLERQTAEGEPASHTIETTVRIRN